MNSQPLIKDESKHGKSAGYHNYQKLLSADKIHLLPPTDINPDSNTERNKNIPSEQSDATLTVMPVL